MSIAKTWGTTPQEHALPFPCDRFLQDADAAYYRGVSVNARPTVVFRWLCQMKVASYSYGSKGPNALLPGLDELVIGQRVMNSFDLVGFERPRQLTLRLRRDVPEARFVREVAVSYLLVAQGSDRSRLLVKTLVWHRRGALGWLMQALVPWGDLIMARKQLLNFKRLAEATERSERMHAEA